MKLKTLLIALALTSTAAMAQTFTVGPMTLVKTSEPAFYPLLTDGARTVLVTQQNYTGVTSVDLASGQQRVLSTEPKAGRHIADSPVTTNDKLQIVLTSHGQQTILTPNGPDNRYLWPQLSPDGKRVAYTLSGQGTWVYDLDTKQTTRVGNLRAARWFDNQWLVAMHDSDDGYAVTASTIVMTNIDGTVQQTLTDDSVMAMYPSALNGHVAFNTPQGQVYVMTVSINR